MSEALFAAAEKAMADAGLKAKSVPAVITKFKEKYGAEATVDNGFLVLTHTGTTLNNGAAFSRMVAENPRDFYGQKGEILYKKDLAGDDPAKVAFISEFGYQAWADLPFDENAPGAKHVITGQIASSHMTKAQYFKLSLEERAKLAGEVGHQGVGKIMNRV